MKYNHILKIKYTLTLLLTIVFSCLCAVAMFPRGKTAKAMGLNYDEFDIIFIETANEYCDEHYNGTIDLTARKEIIYDIDLNKLGYIYDFTLNEQNGYSIVVNTKGSPEVAEIYFNSLNPFNGINSKKIYISNTLYAFYNDTKYYLITGEEIAEEGIENLRNISFYSGNTSLITSSETIYYTTKVETDVLQMAIRHPSITAIGYSNACVPVAGANVIQYWDRYLPNLIENYNPGVAVGNYYLYNKADSTVKNMAVRLYNLMGTNASKDGTTISQFKSGMSAYCSGKGYGIMFESCMSGGQFDYLLSKEKMGDGHPLVLFTDPFTVATISGNENSDQIKYIKVAAAHSMAGFGYKDISYTLSNGQTRVDNYIEVASGLMECGDGYYNIDYDTIIDDAYGIYIF